MTEVKLNSAVAMTFENTGRNNSAKKNYNASVDGVESGNKNREKRPRVDKQQRVEQTREMLTQTLQKDGGKFITFGGGEDGILCAALEQDEKFYFLWLDKDRKTQITSTKESYKLLRDIPNNLSVLYYLYQTQRNYVVGVVQNWVEENSDDYKILGNVGVKAHKTKQNGGNNKSKKTNDKKKHKADKAGNKKD